MGGVVHLYLYGLLLLLMFLFVWVNEIIVVLAIIGMHFIIWLFDGPIVLYTGDINFQRVLLPPILTALKLLPNRIIQAIPTYISPFIVDILQYILRIDIII